VLVAVAAVTSLELWAVDVVLLDVVDIVLPLLLPVLVRGVIVSVGRLVSVPVMELIWLDREAGLKTEPRELGSARAAEAIDEPRLSAAEV